MFLKSTKPKFIKLITILLLFILCCGVAISGSGFSQRSGKELFKTLVLDPIPKSVIILNSHDSITLASGLDNRVWLHFNISPNDLNLVLASRNWKNNSDVLVRSGVPEIQDWWYPQSIGNNATEYSMLIMSEGDQEEDREEIEYMWVKSDRSEVYLFYVDGFMR